MAPSRAPVQHPDPGRSRRGASRRRAASPQARSRMASTPQAVAWRAAAPVPRTRAQENSQFSKRRASGAGWIRSASIQSAPLRSGKRGRSPASRASGSTRGSRRPGAPEELPGGGGDEGGADLLHVHRHLPHRLAGVEQEGDLPGPGGPGHRHRVLDEPRVRGDVVMATRRGASGGGARSWPACPPRPRGRRGPARPPPRSAPPATGT
jgi:hypothetical protein